MNLPRELVMKNQTQYRTCGIALGTMAVAAIVACNAWAAQPKDMNRSLQDTPAARSAGRDNSPPATNRQVERQAPPQSQKQAPPQFRRSSNEQPRSSQTRRDIPVSRGNETPPAGQALRRDNSPPPAKNLVKNVESTRLAQNIQPPAPSAGNRRIGVVKDVKDSGNKGAGTNQTPIKRETPKSIVKGLPVKGSGDAKNLNSSSAGNKSSIGDVRNRLGDPKGQKNVQPQPDRRTALDAAKNKNVQKNAFQERLKAGDLNRLTAGATAKKLKLADQYRMYQQGDVARRLNLQKHGNHPIVYRGVVSPIYQRQCMKYYYWGPSFFAGVCWYPRWNPWVQWSWYHHCNPYWDPRPFWCRPVIYRRCPVWVYWNTPAWTPLPAVACGTWVDLMPVEIPAADSDLQLVAVRFVDPGHPEEKLGPRYRVWFRNNGSQPIAQPFNVMLFAGNDERLAANMPQAGVRVTGVDAGDMQSVDIRLPVEVYAMRHDTQGNPAPFSVLQVLVDANREVAETTDANNGARLTPAEILPVDPASFELQPKAAKPGEEVLLAGEGFGPQPGRVLVQVNGREMDGEILGWYDLGVRWTMPKLSLAAPVEADVIVIRGDGAAANPVKVTLTP